jgi:hypothetical protein
MSKSAKIKSEENGSICKTRLFLSNGFDYITIPEFKLVFRNILQGNFAIARYLIKNSPNLNNMYNPKDPISSCEVNSNIALVVKISNILDSRSINL